MTLLPGDVILTGTPAGVGFTRKPPEFLKVNITNENWLFRQMNCIKIFNYFPFFLQKGDILETEIESLGRLKNKCVWWN